MSTQLHFDFYATRQEFVSAFVEQMIHLAPKFRIKGRGDGLRASLESLEVGRWTMNATNLGICTMPGCMTQAKWVHGTPLEEDGGEQVFPWELCDCCHESVVAADRVLAVAGIDFPDEVAWCFEAARARRQRMLKVEALKKA